MNSEMSASRPVEPVRAATTAKSAMAPSGTGFLVPLSVPPEALQLDRLRRRIALAFEQRQRADRFARRDLRQPLLLLRVAAGEHHALRRRDRPSRRTAPARARGPFPRRSRRVRDGRRRRRRTPPGSRRRGSPSRRGPSTTPCRRSPCRRALRAPPSAGIFRRGTAAPGRAAASDRRRNRNSWRSTRVACWSFRGAREARTRNLDVSDLWIPDRSDTRTAPE